jgi:hypothetical protein
MKLSYYLASFYEVNMDRNIVKILKIWCRYHGNYFCRYVSDDGNVYTKIFTSLELSKNRIYSIKIYDDKTVNVCLDFDKFKPIKIDLFGERLHKIVTSGIENCIEHICRDTRFQIRYDLLYLQYLERSGTNYTIDENFFRFLGFKTLQYTMIHDFPIVSRIKPMDKDTRRIVSLLCKPVFNYLFYVPSIILGEGLYRNTRFAYISTGGKVVNILWGDVTIPKILDILKWFGEHQKHEVLSNLKESDLELHEGLVIKIKNSDLEFNLVINKGV